MEPSTEGGDGSVGKGGRRTSGGWLPTVLFRCQDYPLTSSKPSYSGNINSTIFTMSSSTPVPELFGTTYPCFKDKVIILTSIGQVGSSTTSKATAPPPPTSLCQRRKRLRLRPARRRGRTNPTPIWSKSSANAAVLSSLPT